MGRLIFSSLPMFVSGFWAILLLCTQIEKYNRSRLVLSLFMVVTALMFYAHCVFFNEMHSEIPVSDTFYSFGVLASYPLFYIFLVSITSTSQHLRRSWLLLLPAVFLSVTVGVMYALMSADETAEFITRCLYYEQFFDFTGIAHHMAIAHLVIKISFAIIVIYVVVAGMNLLVKYDRHIKSVYSNLEGKTLISFKIFLYLFFFTSVASFAFNIVGRYHFDSTFWALTLPSVVFSVLIFILGLLGLRQSFTFESMNEELEEQDQDSAPQSMPYERDKALAEDLAKRIEKVIEEKQALPPAQPQSVGLGYAAVHQPCIYLTSLQLCAANLVFRLHQQEANRIRHTPYHHAARNACHRHRLRFGIRIAKLPFTAISRTSMAVRQRFDMRKVDTT